MLGAGLSFLLGNGDHAKTHQNSRTGRIYIRVMFILNTFHSLLVDISEKTGLHLEAPVDLPLSWVLVEGPQLDKDMLRYLEEEGLERPNFPEWLLPLWERFVLTDEPRLLGLLRQVLVFCYKAEFEPTQKQLHDAEMRFVETDLSVGVWNEDFKSRPRSHVMRTARRYLSRCIYSIKWSEIIPSHGPGAVFPPRKPWKKSKFTLCYPELAALYPYDQYFVGISSFWDEVLAKEHPGHQALDSRITCNLTAVPKDSRGPRLICVHPAEAIWIQQGQRRLLENAITKMYGSWINFNDQSINGNAALKASADREYCTLDLKDASDRIGLELVRYLFGDASRFLEASRAVDVRTLSGRVLTLEKFAPMGNCLTFPVQSIIFYSLVRAGIRCHHGIDCDAIYVFGDDILFPSKFYDAAVSALVEAGLVPNTTKTFRRGLFRESCGVDAYNGVRITPHRMKVAGIRSDSNAVSLCALAKSLRMDGYDHCSSFIYSKVREYLGKRRKMFLHLSNDPNVQGIYEYVKDARTVLLYEPHVSYFRGIQQYMTRYLLHRASVRTVLEGDWYHLQDSLIRLAHRGDSISDRGTEYSVPYRERLTYGWTPLLFK